MEDKGKAKLCFNSSVARYLPRPVSEPENQGPQRVPQYVLNNSNTPRPSYRSVTLAEPPPPPKLHSLQRPSTPEDDEEPISSASTTAPEEPPQQCTRIPQYYLLPKIVINPCPETKSVVPPEPSEDLPPRIPFMPDSSDLTDEDEDSSESEAEEDENRSKFETLSFSGNMLAELPCWEDVLFELSCVRCWKPIDPEETPIVSCKFGHYMCQTCYEYKNPKRCPAEIADTPTTVVKCRSQFYEIDDAIKNTPYYKFLVDNLCYEDEDACDGGEDVVDGGKNTVDGGADADDGGEDEEEEEDDLSLYV